MPHTAGGSRLDTTPAVPVKKSCGTARAEHCPAQRELQDEETRDDQAEQSPTQITKDQPEVCDDRAEPRLIATQDPSSSSSYTINTRQSHTTQWAVARYVPSPSQLSFVPILTTQISRSSPYRQPT